MRSNGFPEEVCHTWLGFGTRGELNVISGGAMGRRKGGEENREGSQMPDDPYWVGGYVWTVMRSRASISRLKSGKGPQRSVRNITYERVMKRKHFTGNVTLTL